MFCNLQTAGGLSVDCKTRAKCKTIFIDVWICAYLQLKNTSGCPSFMDTLGNSHYRHTPGIRDLGMPC